MSIIQRRVSFVSQKSQQHFHAISLRYVLSETIFGHVELK